ncbi:PREDICTED: apolipoprotein A-V-like [Pygoscelis adeliae]|nr:PREDICTED: apolipoprotein A-V-like [Pygoscelis adeliae]
MTNKTMMMIFPGLGFAFLLSAPRGGGTASALEAAGAESSGSPQAPPTRVGPRFSFPGGQKSSRERPSRPSTAFIAGAFGHGGDAAVSRGCSVTTPAVSCRNLKGSIQDGVSYMGNFLEKLAPLNRGLQPRLYHDSDSLRKLIRKELESLRVKLSPYVDEVHHKVGKHLEDLRHRLQPFTEELLDQVSLKARELRRHLMPSREATAQLLEGADEVQRFMAQYADKIAFHTGQVKDIFRPYADRLVTEIHRNVEELHRNVVPHAQASPEQLNRYIQELSAKLTQNARHLHQKIQGNLEQLQAKLRGGGRPPAPPDRYAEELAREVQRRVEEFRRDTYLQIQDFTRALDQETEEMRLKLSSLRAWDFLILLSVPVTQVLQFNTNCPECNAPANTNMKLVQIPHFKEVIIMATNCDSCGHRTNEVKSGGAIEPQGTRITLRITDPSDMTRDILKVQCLGLPALSCGGCLPERVGPLLQVERNPFTLGDSSRPSKTEKLREFVGKLHEIAEGKTKAHFIMDDPAGNSYLQVQRRALEG